MGNFSKHGDLLIRLIAWAILTAIALFAFVPSVSEMPGDLIQRIVTPLIYLLLSLGCTVWVARSLQPSWQPLLQRRFGDTHLAEPLARTLSNMLILLGVGLAALLSPRDIGDLLEHARIIEQLEAFQNGVRMTVYSPPTDGMLEVLAYGVGRMLLVLGVLSLGIARFCWHQPPRAHFDGPLSLPDLPTPPVPNADRDHGKPAQKPKPRGGQPLAW